jgi:hypothetical protein
MKNLLNFRDFSLNEGYYEDYGWGREKERKTEVAKRLETIRQRALRRIDYSNLSQPKPWEKGRGPNPVNWLLGKAYTGLLGASASVADLFAPKEKDGKEKDKPESKGEKKSGFEEWKGSLGEKATEKDLEDFITRSEIIGKRKFGSNWDYKNPKTPEEKKYAQEVRKGELEILQRMPQ